VPLKVLLVESRSKDSHSVEPDLVERGDEVVVTHTPRKAPSLAVADWPDLVVVNVCSGFLDVKEICQALDETRLEFPRLIVSRDEVHNHRSNEMFLLIPYSPRQLTQRINKAIGDQNDRFLRIGNITVDDLKRNMKRSDRVEHLTPKECRLLHLLMEHWETEYLGDTRTLDVHIRWLREKLEDDPSHPRFIITVRGVGYRFSPQP
jgi:DNA-binding response OmpR family regulator